MTLQCINYYNNTITEINVILTSKLEELLSESLEKFKFKFDW